MVFSYNIFISLLFLFFTSVAVRAWSSVSCGQRGGGANQQVTRDDYHLCLVTTSLIICVSVLSVSPVTAKKRQRVVQLAELARYSTSLHTRFYNLLSKIFTRNFR